MATNSNKETTIKIKQDITSAETSKTTPIPIKHESPSSIQVNKQVRVVSFPLNAFLSLFLIKQ